MSSNMTMSAVSGGSTSTDKLGYEPNGNIMSDTKYISGVADPVQTLTYLYDGANRLSKYRDGGIPIANYYYNYMNQRVLKSAVNNGATEYSYDLSGNMIYSTTGVASGYWEEYIYLGGHRIALLKAPQSAPPIGGGCAGGGSCALIKGDTWQTVAGNALACVLIPCGLITIWYGYKNGKYLKGLVILSALSGGIVFVSYMTSKAQTPPPAFDVFFYLNDHLDTPQKMINSSGQVVWAGKYDPFGTLVWQDTDVDLDGIPTYNYFRFPGQYEDAETGLYYNWNRYYNPQWGRYMQADIVGQSGSLKIMH